MNDSSRRPLRLAYLVSHPIHYQAPLLRLIAAEPDIELKVFFQSDYLLRPAVDADYGVSVDWQADLIGGATANFCRVSAVQPSVFSNHGPMVC